MDFPSFTGFDWALLHECTQRVLDQPRRIPPGHHDACDDACRSRQQLHVD